MHSAEKIFVPDDLQVLTIMHSAVHNTYVPMNTGYEICCYCKAIDGDQPHEEDCLLSLPADEPAVADEAANELKEVA